MPLISRFCFSGFLSPLYGIGDIYSHDNRQ